jgi:hypothetical protein
VALHAGPVTLWKNPVTARPDCIGTHVNLAARLEPSTPLNHVYTTRSFRALTAANDLRGYEFQPVGMVRLSKSFGMLPAYQVQRAD